MFVSNADYQKKLTSTTQWRSGSGKPALISALNNLQNGKLNMHIKSAVLADASELEDIYASSFKSNASFFPDDMEEDDDEDDFSFEVALTVSNKSVLAFWEDGRLIGGAVISQVSREISIVDRLFIIPEQQGKGYGYNAWVAIEKLYPCVKEWTLRTPTCLINNVCFYVNKCGFSVIRVEDMGDDGVGMYVFSKLIR